jgi:trimeric autotransporter adhesin
MASTYSPLKIELIGTGDQSGTWGTTTNTNLGTALEEAITGSADVTFASGTVTLTLTDTNATQTARNLRLNLTGTSGGAQNLIVPAIEKLYLVNNGCADAITVKNSTGTGIAVPAGKTMFVFNNGTNVVDAVTYLTSLATPSATITGGTIAGITQLDVAGTSAAGANLKLYEDTDNGTNYVSLKAADTIASNVTFTLPAADGTNGQALITNGSGTLSFGSAGISTGKAIAMAMIFGG